MRRSTGSLAWTGALAACGTGCPANTCFLTVNGRCKWSSCPDGAEFDTLEALVHLRGQPHFVERRVPHRRSGQPILRQGSHFENGGCTPNRCPPGLRSTRTPGTASPPSRPPKWPATWACRSEESEARAVRRASSWWSKGPRRRAFRCSRRVDATRYGTAALARRRAVPAGLLYDPPSNTCVKFARAPTQGVYGRSADLGTQLVRTGRRRRRVELSVARSTSIRWLSGFARGARCASKSRLQIQVRGRGFSASVPTAAVVGSRGASRCRRRAPPRCNSPREATLLTGSGGGKSTHKLRRHGHLQSRELLGAHRGDGLGRLIVAAMAIRIYEAWAPDCNPSQALDPGLKIKARRKGGLGAARPGFYVQMEPAERRASTFFTTMDQLPRTSVRGSPNPKSSYCTRDSLLSIGSAGADEKPTHATTFFPCVLNLSAAVRIRASRR